MRRSWTAVVADVVFLAILAGFFAAAALFVRGCERVVGRAEPVAVAESGEPSVEAAA